MGADGHAGRVRQAAGVSNARVHQPPVKPNGSVRSVLRGLQVQAKLTVGAVNDPAEAEADQVADQVMRMPEAAAGGDLPPASNGSEFAPVRRLCADCEEDEIVQTKEAPGAGPALTAASEGTIMGLRGGGVPLPAAERAFFEPRFGRSFERVRIHDGANAGAAAKGIQARAFTLGNDIAFAGGEYRPGSSGGRRLMAHELTHVIQQGGGGGDAVVRRDDEPDPWQYPDPRTGDWYSPESFTELRPRRLASRGPFTYWLLEMISSTYTEAAMWHEPETAHAILAALESSSTFVAQAAYLDRHYRQEDTPEIRFHWSNGSRFIPARAAHLDDWIEIDRVSTGRTSPQPDNSSASEYQTMAFVRLVIHESAHAYRHVRRLESSGLSGHLRGEARTREREQRMLEEVRRGASPGGLRDEATRQLGLVGATDVRAIATNITSGTNITYVESFFVNGAIRTVYPLYRQHYRGSAVEQLEGYGDLPGHDDFERGDCARHIGAHRQVVLGNSRAPSPPSTPRVEPDAGATDSSPPATTPPIPAATTPATTTATTTAADGPPASQPAPLISGTARSTLLQLLDFSGDLQTLVAHAPPADMSEGALALFYRIQLLQIYCIRFRIEAARAASSAVGGTPAHRSFLDGIARDHLGVADAYSSVLGPAPSASGEGAGP